MGLGLPASLLLMAFFLLPFLGLLSPRSECRVCARKSSHCELLKSLLCCCYEITKHHTRSLRHGNAKILCMYVPPKGGFFSLPRTNLHCPQQGACAIITSS